MRMAAETPPIFTRTGDDGQPIVVKNPLYSQARDLTKELRAMAREFGLTPSCPGRAGVELVTGVGPDRLFTTGRLTRPAPGLPPSCSASSIN